MSFKPRFRYTESIMRDFGLIEAARAVRYYQKRTGPEIDFVIPDKGLAVEVKSRGNDRDMARLDKLAEARGLAERYIVSREYTDGRGIILATEI